MTESKTSAPIEKSNKELVEAPASSTSGSSAPAAIVAEPNGDGQAAAAEKKPEKKTFWTWERTIEILKLVATIWVALLGSFVTMQFNERQHELSRIEAIAKILPHIAHSSSNNKSETAPNSPEIEDMGRDGAIWAVFRTASNRTMLRDLAALFPKDIYRVVSSIAVAGELDHDSDALVALQVSSEKLAARYSTDPRRAELANKLYAQALRLKERKPDDPTPLQVVDLSSELVHDTKPTDDQMASLVKSINDLAEVHLRDSNMVTKKQSTASHSQAKQLYQRARQLGLTDKDEQVMEQVVRSDLALATLAVEEQLADDAFLYLKEALTLESKITGKPSLEANLKALDKNGDGFANLTEMEQAIKLAQGRLKEILVQYQDKGASLK